MDHKLYSVKCIVDNGCTKEKWEAFVFADCRNTARYIATTYFEKQSMETIAYDAVCEEIECNNRSLVCTRRIEY